MPLGVLINCLSVFLGAVLGAALSSRITDDLQEKLPVLFGFCAMGIGVHSIVKASSMAAVVMAVILGYCLGNAIRLEARVHRFLGRLLARLCDSSSEEKLSMLVTFATICCFSGFGWYGALTESLSGSPDILISKSVLDFFTAVLFAAVIGKTVCFLPVGQIAVMMIVFFAGKFIAPYISAEAFLDMSACGGLLTFATGLRISKIKPFPILDFAPALILVCPISQLLSMLL